MPFRAASGNMRAKAACVSGWCHHCQSSKLAEAPVVVGAGAGATIAGHAGHSGCED